MDFSSITTVIGIIILLASLGLLKPIRNFTTGLGADVDVVNNVKTRLVKEWDADSALAHDKKMIKVYDKASELGEIRTYEDVMAKLRQNRVEE